MTNYKAPRAVTVSFFHIPTQLHEEIITGSSRSGAVVDLLKELVQFRLDRASEDALAQEAVDEEQLSLELAGAKGAVAGLQVVADQRKREIEELNAEIEKLKTENSLVTKLLKTRTQLDREALSHAIQLINHLDNM